MLDTSPLIILVVGSVEPELLGATPHLKAFTPEDFLVLGEFLSRFDTVATTPHVATEVAHFVGKIAGRGRPEVRIKFVELIHWLTEIPITSRSASARADFAWLDLADCTLLEATGPYDILLTTDAPLASRRQALGLPAVNFNELREQAGIL